jgi:putative transposase
MDFGRILFFIHLGSRRVSIAGITDPRDAGWFSQLARNATSEELRYLHGGRYVLQGRDAKFCEEFRQTMAAEGVSVYDSPRGEPASALGGFSSITPSGPHES